LSLYENPGLYSRAIGAAEPEEVAFYADELAVAQGPILSLGCGAGRVEAPLVRLGFEIVGVDASRDMLRAARGSLPANHFCAARIECLPFAEGLFGGAYSALLSFAYLIEEQSLRYALHGIARVLAAGAPLLLDVPVCHAPRRLQGLRELLREGPLEYRFDYFDVVSTHAWGSVMATRIGVVEGAASASRDAMLTAFTPEGIRLLLTDEGLFEEVSFAAPHDRGTWCELPEQGCRRAIVRSVRR